MNNYEGTWPFLATQALFSLYHCTLNLRLLLRAIPGPCLQLFMEVTSVAGISSSSALYQSSPAEFLSSLTTQLSCHRLRTTPMLGKVLSSGLHSSVQSVPCMSIGAMTLAVFVITV